MFIHYKLHRSKNDDIIEEGKIQFNLTSDDHLIALDDIVVNLLSNYVNSLEIVQKNGIAYVGNMEITSLEITNEDTIVNMDVNSFNSYFKGLGLNPNIKLIWNKKVKIEME